MTNPTTENNGQDITLRDVVNHMSQGFSELRKEMNAGFSEVHQKIDGNRTLIEANQESLVALQDRVQSLHEDVETALNDTVKIRRHVGMFAGDGS